MWAILAGVMWAVVSAVFGLAFWAAKKADRIIPPFTIFAAVAPLALPFGAAYVSYYFSHDLLMPLSALAIGSLFGFQLALVLKKRLSPKP